MLTIGIVLNFTEFCWLLFSPAVYALLFFIAVTCGFYAFQSGAGPLGAMVFGLCR